MDALELEATLVRHEAAMRAVTNLDGLDLLTQVIWPGEDFHRASLDKARETGPRALALKISSEGMKPAPDLRARTHVSKVRARVVSLDELLASLG